MNIPPNRRPFDINLAQQSHNLCTRDNRPAKFIAYVPEANPGDKVLVMVSKTVHGYHADGTWRTCSNDGLDLFLAPLGMCEGLPVFAGDKLYSDKEPVIINVEDNEHFINGCKWPSKLPVVETRMTESELYTGKPLVTVANKAIERAILDGDVIPTSAINKLLKDAENDRVQPTFRQSFETSLLSYLEGLK